MSNKVKYVLKGIMLVLSSFIVSYSQAQFSTTEQIVTVDSSMLSITIKFENTTRDTLHSVLIIDTLSEFLQEGSFELGISSHHYDFFYLDHNVVCWHIYNVHIPGVGDKEKNHGFVKYHIDHIEREHALQEVINRPAIYYNYDSDFDIDVNNVSGLQHHEFVGIEHKANVHLKLTDNHDDTLILSEEDEFEDDQIYVEIFDDNGTVEFLGKINKDSTTILNTSFLKSGHHYYLDVYDDHHHEVIKDYYK